MLEKWNRTSTDEILASARHLGAEEEKIQLDSDKKMMDAATKQMAAIAALNKGLGTNLRVFNPEDKETAAALIQALSILNPALANLGKNEQSNAAYTKDVSDAIKRLTTDIGHNVQGSKQLVDGLLQVALHQEALNTAAGKTDVTLQKQIAELVQLRGQMAGTSQSIRSVSADLMTSVNTWAASAAAATNWGDIMVSSVQALQKGIEASFAALISGSQSAGAAIIQAITGIVAHVLEQFGTMLISRGIAAILMGEAINADPFTVGMGSALIAAGVKEVAEGSILTAIGGVVSGLGGLAGGSSAAATGSSASAAATGSSTSAASTPTREGPSTLPPERIPINATGSGDVIVHVHVDPLSGKVVTPATINGPHKKLLQDFVKNTVKITKAA
jgi:hypothetical protein